MIYGPKITRLKVQTKSKLEQRSSVDNIQLGIYQRNRVNMKPKQHNCIQYSTKNSVQNISIIKLLKIITKITQKMRVIRGEKIKYYSSKNWLGKLP